METQTKQHNHDHEKHDNHSCNNTHSTPSDAQMSSNVSTPSDTKVMPITKEMTIGELVQKYPSCSEVLLEAGVHCVGCGAAFWETIEQGLKGHGMTDEDVDEVVKQLNDAIPTDAGGSNDTVVVTEKAAEKLKDILKEQKKEGYGLRIEVLPGGCSGFQYAFDFENEKKENDTVIEVSGVNFYVDNESIKLLKGARIDYVDSLQGAGFKISNPNAKSTCGCGQSFS